MSMKDTSAPTESIARQIAAYGFDSFLDAADTQLKILDPESADHAILSYLRKYAVGLENAKPWQKIEEHLEEMGHDMIQKRFQNGLLQSSRRALYYIGSCNAGYFLFAKPSDVKATRAFYRRRIGKEKENWDALEFLATQLGFDRVDEQVPHLLGE
ncbi:MAG: hypothetical protein H6966_10235 [Chromatiaceae bacterium]|nr:hypothetical protein [Chromatiaceae bacterium]